MLGAKVESLTQVQLPCFASLKLDGIRAIWQSREFFSRTLKTLANRNLQGLFSQLQLLDGFDGELILGEPNAPDVFRRTSSVVNSINKSVDGVRFFVFDNCNDPSPYWKRIENTPELLPHVVKLDQVLIESYAQLVDFEEYAVSNGYEGIICRRPDGRYKFGRSTLNEQLLLKVKRFVDAEGRVIGFEELEHNANPATLDERGYTKRSSHREGKVHGGVLGALLVEWEGKTVRVGTGFTGDDRKGIWRNQRDLLGALAKFRYFPVGMKDLPRHPSFQGFRDVTDL